MSKFYEAKPEAELFMDSVKQNKDTIVGLDESSSGSPRTIWST